MKCLNRIILIYGYLCFSKPCELVTYFIHYLLTENLLGKLVYDSYKTIHYMWNISCHLVVVDTPIAFGEHAFQI